MPKAKVNGIEIAYEVHGEGVPLVLAHGYTATQEMWERQIGPFSERYRVVVYDLRGHGESEVPPAGDPGYTLDMYVADQRALMEHLGIEDAYVGGLSMGGSIAMRFALAYPGVVRALLLLDTSAGPEAGDWSSDLVRSLWHQNRAAIEAGVRSAGVLSAMGGLFGLGQQAADLLPEEQRTQFDRTTELTPERLSHLEQLTPDGFLGAGDALFSQTSVLQRMPEIAVPTLVLVGDQDFLLEPSKQMHAKLPNARFVLIKDSTHGTCVWQPKKFSDAVLDFLSDLEAGRPLAGCEER